MSCEFCDLDRITGREDFDPHADYIVGEWAFTKDDDLIHHSQGRINLCYPSIRSNPKMRPASSCQDRSWFIAPHRGQ